MRKQRIRRLIDVARRIDKLLAEIEGERARLNAYGLMPRETRKLWQLIDELAQIVKGQFKEIATVKKKIRKRRKNR